MVRKATGVSFGWDDQYPIGPDGSNSIRSGWSGWLVRHRRGGRQEPVARLKIGAEHHRRVMDEWPDTPHHLASADGRAYWGYRHEIWLTEETDLSSADVKALLSERENRKRLKLQKAHSLQAMTGQLDERGRRQSIPREVKLHVWQRDGGVCVACGSRRELEYDHIIPVAMGGSTTERNLQLLCADCNRRKGATLGGEDLASA